MIRSRYRNWNFRLAVFLLSITALSAGSAGAKTAEEQNSFGVYQIKADAIHALGVNGKYVTITTIDTGIMSAHPEFSGRVLTGYNAFDGSTNAIDDNGHGTHVAGISAAGKNNPSTSGMFGVAYNAYLLPVKVLDARGSGTSASVAKGIQYAVNQRNSLSVAPEFKPFAMNISLGSSAPSSDIETSLRNAVSSGMAVAAAAGNDGGANPIWPARYARETWANGQIIAVGAVDSNNNIAYFSNRAGDTKNFYLVAPGVNIYSTYTVYNRKTRKYDPAYAILSGTSMATPYVTGAIALIKSGWNHLTAQQITSILLSSATDLGAAGVDSVYGHGLLNLQAALSPLGALNFATGTGQLVSASGTQIVSGKAFGGMSQLSSALGNMVVYDSYMRGFPLDVSSLLATQGSSDEISPAALQVMGDTDAGQHHLVTLDDETWLALSGNAESSSDGWSYGISRHGAFIGFGQGSGASLSFNDARWNGRSAFVHTDPGASGALLDLVSDGAFATAGFDVNSRSRLAVSVLGTGEDASDDVTANAVIKSQGAAVAYTIKATDRTQMSLTSSFLNEKNSLLGSYSGGALDLGSAKSASFGVGANIRMLGNWMLGFDAAYAVTDTGGGKNSLISGMSRLSSRSIALGLSNNNLTGIGDVLGISISKPLKVVKGNAIVSVPVGTDDNGQPVVESYRADLASRGDETDLNLTYERPLGEAVTGGLNMVYRRDADNISGATDSAAMYHFKLKF